MDDCNSVENMWTSCLLVEAWVVSVTLYQLLVYYNIHYKVRDRYGEMAQRLRALVILFFFFLDLVFLRQGFSV